MGKFSRNKGKVGERELARELARVLGVTARRGVQFQGGPDSPDVVVDIPDLHIECKRTERFRLYDAVEQAVEDAGTKIPVVLHRANKKPWVAVIRLDDLPRLAERLQASGFRLQEKNEADGVTPIASPSLQSPASSLQPFSSCQPNSIPEKSGPTLKSSPVSHSTKRP